MPQSLHRKGDVGLEEPYTHPSDRRTLTDVEVAARLGCRVSPTSLATQGRGPSVHEMAVRSATDPDVDEYYGRLRRDSSATDHAPVVISAFPTPRHASLFHRAQLASTR